MATLREQIIARLDELNEEQLTTLLHTANWLVEVHRQSQEYDEFKDPVLRGGSFEGSPDLSEKSREILHGRAENETVSEGSV